MRYSLLAVFLFVFAGIVSTGAWGCAAGGSSDGDLGDGDIGTADGGGGGPADSGHGVDGSGHKDGGPGLTDTGGGHKDATGEGSSGGEGGGGGKFTIGGMVTGLLGTGLVLQDNGSDNLTITKNGAFTFAVPVASGGAYDVTAFIQPVSPSQTCSVTAGSGTVAKGAVTSVVVNCTANTYTIGGMISGLAGTVVLQDNGGDNLTLTTNGSFAFATPLAMGATYTVTVFSEPTSPAQACALSGNTGTVGSADVTTVEVVCTTDSFTIGGMVTTLSGTGLVLQDNGGDNLPIASSGAFTFATPVASGSSYTVTVYANPSGPTQICNVSSGLGTVTTADITTVEVACTTQSYTVGGTVTGLATGDSVVLQDNGGDNLTVSTNGSFTFATPVLSGATYSATVLTEPKSPAQTCVVTSGSGTVGGADVTSIVVTCTTTGSCGRFTSGFSGSWSTVAANPLAAGMGMSGYLPAGGTATTYLFYSSTVDQFTTSTDAYTALAASPVAFSDWPSAAWYGNALWSMQSGDVLRYDIPTNSWTTPKTGLTVAASSQTTTDDSGNLWSFQSTSALLEYDTSTGTATTHALTTSLGSYFEGRVVFDSCTDLLYITNFDVLPFYSYNPSTGVQTALAELPGGNAFQDGLCSDHSGHIFAVTDTATMYQYTIATNTWKAMPAGGPTGDAESACGIGADGYLYATDPGESTTMYRILLK
jgi:hypothetical protein